jgi:predicted small lipoprotein YifL
MHLLLLPALAGLLLLSGCGQKGPLYIPKESSNIASVINTSASLQPFRLEANHEHF